MNTAHINVSHSAADAAGNGVRARGSLRIHRLPGMAHRTTALLILRGVSQ